MDLYECQESSFELESYFIKLLGYHLEDCKKFGNWKIYNDNEKVVGYLICNEHNYHTVINDDKIQYDMEGKIDDKPFKTFKYKVEKEYTVIQIFTNYPFNARRLEIRSDSMFIGLSFTTCGCGYIELYHRIGSGDNKRTYAFEYCCDKRPQDPFGKYSYLSCVNYPELGLINDKDYYSADFIRGKMMGDYHHSSNNEISDSGKIIFDGTADELALQHQEGIKLFDKVRETVNEIIPHSEGVDIINSMFSEVTINYYHLNPFFQNYERNKIR